MFDPNLAYSEGSECPYEVKISSFLFKSFYAVLSCFSKAVLGFPFNISFKSTIKSIKLFVAKKEDSSLSSRVWVFNNLNGRFILENILKKQKKQKKNNCSDE